MIGAPSVANVPQNEGAVHMSVHQSLRDNPFCYVFNQSFKTNAVFFLHILCPDLKNKLSMHDKAHLHLNGDTHRQNYLY